MNWCKCTQCGKEGNGVTFTTRRRADHELEPVCVDCHKNPEAKEQMELFA